MPGRAIVLVSKDINMRIKARALGLPAEDYFNDKTLEDGDLLYTGVLPLPADFWERHGKTMESWQQGGLTYYRINGPMVPVLLVKTFGTRWGLDDGTIALVALAAFLGHLFPVFFRFQGGKGVATFIGAVFGIDWVLGLATGATWLIVACRSLIAFHAGSSPVRRSSGSSRAACRTSAQMVRASISAGRPTAWRAAEIVTPTRPGRTSIHCARPPCSPTKRVRPA